MKKKNILLMLPIILLIIVVGIIIFVDYKEHKIDFNTDLSLNLENSKINNHLITFSNEQYNIDEIDVKELSLEEEQKITELAFNITNAYNDIQNDQYIANIEKYVVRRPENKLDETLVLTDAFQEWSNKLISIEALANLFQSRNATFEKINDSNITYTSSERTIIQVYVDNYNITYGNEQYGIDAIFEYEVIYEDSSDMYKVNKLTVEWISDLDNYYQQTEKNERYQNQQNATTLANISSYIPSSYTNFDYSKLKDVSSNTIENIYNHNKDSIVIIDSSTQGGTSAGSASGFYIREGILVTSYDSISSMIKNGAARYYAVSSDEQQIQIEGIVAVYPKLNIAILKLKEEKGTKVRIGDSSTLSQNDPIVVISSSLGLKSSIKLGIYFDSFDDDYKIIRTSLPLIDGDSGSAVFNLNGEVVAINTNVSTSSSQYNSGLNNAIDISILKDVISKLNNQKFEDINAYNFDNLNQTEELKVINEVPTNLWNKYENLPLITKIVPLTLYSAYNHEDYLIVRYKSGQYNVLTDNEILKLYGKNLTNHSYKQLSTNVYQKNDITIRLQNNLGYIIVIVEGMK